MQGIERRTTTVYGSMYKRGAQKWRVLCHVGTILELQVEEQEKIPI